MEKSTANGLPVRPREAGGRVVMLAAAAARRAAAAPQQPAPGGEPLAAPQAAEIDLQAQIDRLHAVKTELELSYWDHPDAGGPYGERFQIMFWIQQVSSRAAALEGVLMLKGVPRVLVRLAGSPELKEIAAACRVLESGLPDGLPFRGVLGRVRGILRATDVISLAAAGGRPG